jgi:hypothetical protein
MATIEPTSEEQMKKDLIDFLSQDDVFIGEYCIRPRIRKVDMSTMDSLDAKLEYTGYIDIELQVYKKIYDNPIIKKPAGTTEGEKKTDTRIINPPPQRYG